MKIRALVGEIFAKQYWHLFNPKFSMYLAYFQNLSFRVPSKFEKYTNLLGILGRIISKCQDLIRKSTPLPGHSLYSSPCMKPRLYFNHYESPCSYFPFVTFTSTDKRTSEICLFLSCFATRNCDCCTTKHHPPPSQPDHSRVQQ